MNKTNIISILKWGLLAVYAYFAYEMLLIPLLLEFSLIGVAIGWGSLLLLYFLIPKVHRKTVTIFLLLTIFATEAFHNIGFLINFPRIMYFLITIIVIFVVGKFYGKLSRTLLLTLLAVSSLIHFTVNSDDLRLANHFKTVWESPILYTGDSVDYFPLFLRDIDGDGQDEIITFGHREELIDLYYERVKKGLDPNRMPYDIESEPLYLYVFKWNGVRLERVDNETIDLEELRHFIPKDYIGFPYYVWQDDFTLVPQTQLQLLAENVGQFGTNPFHVMDLNVNALSQYASILDGVYDKKNDFRLETDIKQLTIQRGELIIERDADVLKIPTRATKIIDLMQTDNGLGILLLSDQLELWTFVTDDELELTHVLTDQEINNIMSSEYIVSDLQNDGVDEILISAETSRIIRPSASDDNWDILFTSKDTSLRFEDIESVNQEAEPSIVALSKSRIRNNPLRFLTGFSYTNEGLKQDWKSFVSLINVNSVDITGDGENELVATIWRSHKIYVLSRHHLPVSAGLITIFAVLVSYTLYRRVKING